MSTITAGISTALASRRISKCSAIDDQLRMLGEREGEALPAPTSLLALLALLSLLLLLPSSHVSFSPHSVSRSRRSIVASSSSSLAFVNRRISASTRCRSRSRRSPPVFSLQSYIGIHSRHDHDYPRNVRETSIVDVCHRSSHVAVCPACKSKQMKFLTKLSNCRCVCAC